MKALYFPGIYVHSDFVWTNSAGTPALIKLIHLSFLAVESLLQTYKATDDMCACMFNTAFLV